MNPPPVYHDALPFLLGGGETGELIRAYDWARTPLGPPDTWPLSLCSLLGVVLHRYQMLNVRIQAFPEYPATFGERGMQKSRDEPVAFVVVSLPVHRIIFISP